MLKPNNVKFSKHDNTLNRFAAQVSMQDWSPVFLLRIIDQRTLTKGRSISVQLIFSLTGLDSPKQENMLLIVSSKATESKPVKLETSCTVIISLTKEESVLCS